MKSAVAAWALFCLVVFLPTAVLSLLVNEAAIERGRVVEQICAQTRTVAAAELRAEIDRAGRAARNRLTEIAANATPKEIEAALQAAGSDEPFAAAFVIDGNDVRVVPSAVYPVGSPETQKLVEYLANDNLVAAMMTAQGEFTTNALTNLTESTHFIVRRFSNHLLFGWILTERSILAGATAALRPELAIEPIKLDLASQTRVISFFEREPVPVAKVFSRSSLGDLPHPAIAGLLTVGGNILFKVDYRDPAAVSKTVRAEKVFVYVKSVAAMIVLVAIAAALFKRARDAQQLADLRTDFVAAVSHELRTPLASVRMFAELLEAGEVPDNERAEVEQALAGETRRLHATLDRMLRYGALARGKLVVEKSLTRVRPILEEASQKRSVVLEVDANLEANLDAGLVGLAVDNLLSNAVKYAPDGGPYVVRARVEGEELVLDVTDRGPGLSKAAQKKVFAPFERADERLSKATEGSGVGLALVRGIARAHGGEACVTSTEGAGSTFTLRLPRA